MLFVIALETNRFSKKGNFMSFTKRIIEKENDLNHHAFCFLKENNYVEQALDGTVFSTYSSDESFIYIKSNYYYKEKRLKESFSLKEFRDKIKMILDLSIEGSAFYYDLNRLD